VWRSVDSQMVWPLTDGGAVHKLCMCGLHMHVSLYLLSVEPKNHDALSANTSACNVDSQSTYPVWTSVRVYFILPVIWGLIARM